MTSTSCRRIGAFQCEPQQIHAEKRLFCWGGGPGVNRFVSDSDAMLVGAHFRAPDPERSTQEHGVLLL
jgi:hypothetical protein